MKNLNEYRGAKAAIAILCLIAIAALCIFSHIGYKKYKVEESYNGLANAMENRIKKEGQVRLLEEDINILGNSYLKTNGNLGMVKVKGINLKLNENQVRFKFPVRYNDLPLLLSSKGKISQNNNNIIYTPEYFKVGIIKVSNETAFNYLNRYLGKKFLIKDSNIILNKDKFFKEIEVLKFEKGALVVAGKDNKLKALKKAN